jgi:DNA gyrase inhibitor GyrI
MFKWIFASLALVLAILFFYVALYVGAFRAVTWKKSAMGPYYLVYTSQRGPYNKISDTIVKAEKAFEELGYECPRTFGRYYDNPETTDSDRLRAEAGCLFDAEPPAVPEGFETKTLPKANYLVAEFHGAPSIGPLKVYPEAKKRLSASGKNLDDLSPMEIYELTPGHGVTTTYLFEL